jgi:GNAT superfamily N-acetyltransferase
LEALPTELPGGVSIRTAAPGDASRLAEFAECTFRDTFGRDNRPEDMEQYVAGAFGEKVQREELADPRGVVLLMESASRDIVGYAQLFEALPPAQVTLLPAIELQRFYLERAVHGLGLAQRLMKSALTKAFDRGASTLWLGVWEHNARAISFYRKLGFADIGAHPFILGADQQTDRIMCRVTRVAD